jgi:hypothetical protein
MLPSVIFWVIILGVFAFWAFAETLLVRGVAGLWRESSAGIILKLIASVLIVVDLAFGIYFFWNGIHEVVVWGRTHQECVALWACFTEEDVLGICICAAFSPVISVLLGLLYFVTIFYEFAWESLMGANWTELLFAICLCIVVFVAPCLRAWLMWWISGKSPWKTGVVLLASWLPLAFRFFTDISTFFQLLVPAS